jgi:hypothetical protein
MTSPNHGYLFTYKATGAIWYRSSDDRSYFNPPGVATSLQIPQRNSGNTGWVYTTPNFWAGTTQGDIEQGDGSGNPSRLAIGAQYYLPQSNGTSLIYDKIDMANSAKSGTVLAKANGGTGSSTGMVGTSTNDNATAGNVGEEITGIQSTYTNFTTTATYQNITSVSLTAGDWDISAEGTLSVNSSTLTATANAIYVVATATAASTGSTEGKNIVYIAQSAPTGSANKISISVPPHRVSIASTTSYYLNAQATFTAGNPQFVGSLRARRIR